MLHSIRQFIEALQDPYGLTRTLGEIEVCRSSDGEPLRWVGNSAVVFKIRCGGRYKMPKCYTRPMPFHPGSSTAIAGPTGTGKTTIIRLILALVYPEKGRIDLTTDDGRTLSVTPDLRINFVYVPQGNTLLSGTIRENLWLGSPGADEEALHKVIRLACAEFVFSLPEGLDTKIGEHGYGLSEGQAQRIAIARALLRPGRIWLFDEASSALDTETTTHLMDNLLQWGKNNTLIFVTHDSRLMERCDQVIHIKE